MAEPKLQKEQGPSREDRLDSWKEIAAYLRRGSRTVQRWEREGGLPIHRLHHDHGSSVYAFKGELDAWWEKHAALSREDVAKVQEFGASVAVLPFTDMSHERDQEYFCEGVAEEIINTLSRLKQIKVASRTAAFRYKGADPHEIGRKLHVSSLLEGSVRKAGPRVRIAVQLTNASSGYQLWSARYERDMSDIFATQDEIATSVAEALELNLTAEDKRALRRTPAPNPRAYDYYLRGRSFYYRYNRRDVEFAMRLFTQAVEVDPEYALAYAGVADCWSYLYVYAERTEDARHNAEEASRRAIEIAPDSAQAQASRGVALSLVGRKKEADRAFDEAARLDPELFEARYFYARHCFINGELDKAVQQYEEAMRIRPEDFQAPLLVAQIYDDLHRPADARASRVRGVQIADEHLKLNPDDARALYMAANGLVALGRHQQGKEAADRALLMGSADPMVLYNVGCIYSMLGLHEEAIDLLGKAARHGLTQRGWFENDSNLDPLRQHPRFQALLRELP